MTCTPGTGLALGEVEHQRQGLGEEEVPVHGAGEGRGVRGLQVHHHRYYAPWLGRWSRPDPAGVSDGLNRFAYVGGDPVGGLDPSGLGTIHDIFQGLKATPRAIAEPALVVHDIFLSCYVAANNALVSDDDPFAFIDPDEVSFLSGTGKRLQRNVIEGRGTVENLRAGAVLATDLSPTYPHLSPGPTSSRHGAPRRRRARASSGTAGRR